MTAPEVVFWLSVFGVFYGYAGYPIVLWIAGRLFGHGDSVPDGQHAPGVSLIVPVHNEESRVARKIANTAQLMYPSDRLQVLFVSDGSTDGTVEMLRTGAPASMTVVELPARGGKASALNAGLERAHHDILVFTDASIALEPDALNRIVRRFADPAVGCVSGEDRIADGGGEGLYGRYELFLRRLESNLHSIVGASGSFYAQRRAICQPFPEGMAPDFLSVLRTVEQGYRAVSEPTAVGSMTSVHDPRHEFERKVRTLIRGMTTLFAHPQLLNPFRHGWFAFALWSHKVARWCVPFFLIGAFVSPLGLLASPWYAAALGIQVGFYACGLAALRQWGGLDRSVPGRIALYFSSVNAAILAAWFKYASGVRQELWTPSRRTGP